jgi:hypothetical protein
VLCLGTALDSPDTQGNVCISVVFENSCRKSFDRAVRCKILRRILPSDILTDIFRQLTRNFLIVAPGSKLNVLLIDMFGFTSTSLATYNFALTAVIFSPVLYIFENFLVCKVHTTGGSKPLLLPSVVLKDFI